MPAADRLRDSAPVVLTVVIGLLVGLGVTYVALRDDEDPVPYYLRGAPSVDAVARPAGAATSASATRVSDAFQAAASRAASPSPAPVVEPRSARAAVDAFLDAEAADRAAEAFALVEPTVQQRYASLAAWRVGRSGRSVPVAHEVTSERRDPASGATDLTVRATRHPEISVYRGFVAAVATEVWRVRRTDAGWRIVGDRALTSEPQLPPDDAARSDAAATADRWLDAAARCGAGTSDRRALQVGPELLGAVSAVDAVCEKGPWHAAAAATGVDAVTDLTPFVAAYGPSVVRWARAVDVRADGGEKAPRFTVVLGPVGQEWRVMGLMVATASSSS